MARFIDPSRFIASKSFSEDAWLEARRQGVTATQVAKAATPAGFEQVVREYRSEAIIEDTPYMRFGREWEGPIAMTLKNKHAIMPNDWVIRSDNNPRHMATPDGLSMDHQTISEIKTTGTEWKTIPAQYIRQVQWQLYVTGANLCVFAYMLRDEFDGVLIPAWFEPEIRLIQRDEDMIEKLVEVANSLWERVRNE